MSSMGDDDTHVIAVATKTDSVSGSAHITGHRLRLSGQRQRRGRARHGHEANRAGQARRGRYALRRWRWAGWRTRSCRSCANRSTRCSPTRWAWARPTRRPRRRSRRERLAKSWNYLQNRNGKVGSCPLWLTCRDLFIHVNNRFGTLCPPVWLCPSPLYTTSDPGVISRIFTPIYLTGEGHNLPNILLRMSTLNAAPRTA